MKTQIIQLDPHDDYISARDKIGWSKTARVLLIIPERSLVLTRELDLVLLKRHCDSLGAQMALVTKNQEIRFRAHKLGIPIFSSPSGAYRKHWRTGNQNKPKELLLKKTDISNREKIDTLKNLAHPAIPAWINRLEFRLLFFALGVLAVLAIAGVLMPAADISLKPAIKPQEITIQVIANAKNEAVSISGAIPAHSISVEVEGRDQIASSGTIDIPDQLASGSAEFSNLTDKPVIIPAGTVVRSTDDIPVRFATTKEITVEAGYGITNSVLIRALKPGITGNLTEGSLVAIEGVLGINLSVQNISPTTGGSVRTSPSPNSVDEKRLYDRLYTSLVQSALQEIKNQMGEGDILLSSQPKDIKVIHKQFDPSDEQPSDQLNLTLQLECQFLVAKTEDLKQLSNMSLDVNLPEGYLPVDNTLSFKEFSEPVETEKAGYQWQMHASRQIQARIDPTNAITLVIGLPPQEAISRLRQNLPLAEIPQITLTPSWWWWMPILPFRVNVVIQ
jgi:hypothetical protein